MGINRCLLINLSNTFNVSDVTGVLTEDEEFYVLDQALELSILIRDIVPDTPKPIRLD